MSIQLYKAIEDILVMPFYKNENARSGGADYGHEAAVAVRIASAGFTEYQKEKTFNSSLPLKIQWCFFA